MDDGEIIEEIIEQMAAKWWITRDDEVGTTDRHAARKTIRYLLTIGVLILDD